MEDEIEDYDWTKSKEFLAELDRSSTEYRGGEVKGVSWKDAKQRVISSHKTTEHNLN